jgi:5-carboxymethyl-2-hydroxymuconic-semialdehyde dehydrogenase
MSDSVVTVAGVAVNTGHFIDGGWLHSKKQFDDVSPVNGELICSVSAGGDEEIAQAVAAAQRAFPAWAALGPQGRQPYLQKLAQSILQRAEAFAAVESLDNGALLTAMQHRLVPRAAENISFFADWALDMQGRTIDSPEVLNHIHYDPAGVCALIAPWNAPLMLTTWKLGPALAAGNTVVIKPPELAPLTSALLAEAVAEAGIPAGVFNMVQGLGSVAGEALTHQPGVRRISFTGSTATARHIGTIAAQNLVPMSAELGGKSALIVCADADLDAAAQCIAGQFMNAGQVCLAGTRLLVDERISEQLQQKVLPMVAGIKVGDPREETTRMGPLISAAQHSKVSGFVDRALAEGARPLCGAKSLGGQYYAPTILSNVQQTMEIVQQEVFGPVLTWQSFASEEEAIALANDNQYGLGGALFTRDESRAQRIAQAIVTGTLWVNCFYVRDLAAPFGGAKHSGIGREGGDWSFDFFCDIKNISVKKESFQQ